MKRMMMTILATALVGGATLACVTAHAETDVDKRLDAAPKGTVEISNLAGELVVSGWSENVVHVTGTLGEGVERLEFERHEDRITVEVVNRKDYRHVEGSDLEIRVPQGSSLRVDAVSAAIEVSGIEGGQDLHTVSGDITTEVFDDELEAETVSGDLDVSGRNAKTFTTLRTVSGDIDTKNVSGELEASTVSGDIDAEAELLSRARLHTTNGRIILKSGLATDGRFDLSTTNGRVELMLDSDRDLDVDAQTFSGAIDNCFGLEAERSRYTPERTLRFQVGEANRKVRIRSMVGRIELCAEARSG
jgi:DUF4097 and DUF4098 domain-containing protein YvlB